MALKFFEKLKSDKKEKNRVVYLTLGFIFLLDYGMFCLHTDKNFFDIFPAIPVIGEKKAVNIFLPAPDAKGIMMEKRLVPVFDSDKRMVIFLFHEVVRGSNFENTAESVPVKLLIKKVWMGKESEKGSGELAGNCVIDVEPSEMRDNIIIRKGSESLFREALAKTIKENVPVVKKVSILVQGIPGRMIWEI